MRTSSCRTTRRGPATSRPRARPARRRHGADAMPGACFHCGEPIGGGVPLLATIGTQSHPVCCIGCRAAVEWIDGLGLADYYRLREVTGERAAPADDYAEWDRPRLARRHVRE